MKVIEVVLHDHTSLGGPMGTERVYDLERRLFSSWVKALDWAWVKGNAMRQDRMPATKEWRKMTRVQKMAAVGDLLSIGFSFTERKVDY